MPTGYTWNVANGACTSFAEYAMQCSRAFGALVHMREDDQSAEIRPRVKNNRHAEEIGRLKHRLLELVVMSDEQAEEEADADYARQLESHEHRVAEDLAQRDRYCEMLEKARAYQSPTVEHDAFRQFMINQLVQSIAHDCGFAREAPKKLPGPEWRLAEKSSAERQLAYHIERDAEEEKSVASANEWVSILRESLKEHA